MLDFVNEKSSDGHSIEKLQFFPVMLVSLPLQSARQRIPVGSTLLMGVLVISCQSRVPIVSAQPLPSATASASLPPTNSTTPLAGTNAPADSPTPPPSRITQLLTNPPAAHVAPPRTCPTLPKRPLNVPTPNDKSAVVVHVADYLSLVPIPNVEVRIFHGSVCMGEAGCKPSHPHPDDQLKMVAKTDAQGEAIFPVPDLDYSSFIPADPIPDHLPFEADYNLGQQKCHPLFHERRTGNGKALIIEQYLIPRSMMAIQNDTDAIDNAFQLEELVTWLRAHQDAEMDVRVRGSSWEVIFGYKNQTKRMVLVDGLNGTAMMLLRFD